MSDPRRMINPCPGNRGTGVGIDFGKVARYPGGYHSGIDMHAPIDSDVLAARGGKVVYAEATGGAYGNRVDIDHGEGLFSVYAHLNTIEVDVGQAVEQSDRIGGCGSTGNSVASHLHFEVRLGGNEKRFCVDPMEWIDPRPEYWEGAWLRS